MKKSNNNIKIAFIFAVGFIFTFIGESRASQTWDCGDQGGNVKCTLDDDGIFTVSGTGKMADYGDSADDPFWVSNAPWGGTRENIAKIKNIVIEDGVTSVGGSAFAGATAVESIYMPSVKNVSSGAFYDNYSLKSLSLPNVETIGGSAFCFNFALEYVDMPNVKEIGDTAFYENPWDP